MTGLTRQDIQVLAYYAREGNRELYWNYLAQTPGNDGYGLLALGVVRNDNMPGRVANQYAQNQASSVNDLRLSEREWDRFGQDLVERDFALRLDHFESGRQHLALNLPVWDVQQAHDDAFEDAGITRNAWTPRELLEAARRQGGEPEAEQVWSSMLNNSRLGMDRLTDTLRSTAWAYNDSQLDATAYLGRLTLATAAAASSRASTDPNTIGANSHYHHYDAREGAWYTVNGAAMSAGGWGGYRRVTDPAQIESLNDTRALRLEQQERARDFHPLDPHRHLARSPRTLADAGPATQPESMDVLFNRLTDAAMARDTTGMRAASQSWRASAEGQQWLQSGQLFNEQAREASRQTEMQATAPQMTPRHRPPVLHL
ncbi:MAG: hypothetical protein R3E94_02980 [Burkholderiaceae bacterium]